MKSSTKIFAAAAVILSFLLLSPEWCCAQKRRKEKKGQETVSVKDVRAGIREAEDEPKDGNGFLPFFVEGGDTIYYDEITASKVYSRLPKQKGKEWRKYYRLVHNFSKSYPYALVAKKLVEEADSTIAADNLKGVKRDRYVNKVQEELFDVLICQQGAGGTFRCVRGADAQADRQPGRTHNEAGRQRGRKIVLQHHKGI